MRLRVKQGLPFDDPLPGASHEAEHPWYDSTEKHIGGQSAVSDNLPSTSADHTSGKIDMRAGGDALMMRTGRGINSTADGQLRGIVEAAAVRMKETPLDKDAALSTDGTYHVDGLDSDGVSSADAQMEQLRGKPLSREAALEGDNVDAVNGADTNGVDTIGTETWREQLLGDMSDRDVSTGKQDAIGPRGKQDTDYLDSSGSRGSADATEDRLESMRDRQGKIEQDLSTG